MGTGGGGTRPPDAEIQRVLREVMATLQDTHNYIFQLEQEILELHTMQARTNKYILTIVQALLRSGVEVPLTTKPKGD